MIYFILGMLTVQAFFPLLDGITSFLLTLLEVGKGYFGVKVAEYNARLKKISYASEESSSVRQIGFTFENEEE